LLKTFEGVTGVGRALTVTRAGFKLSGGEPDVELPPPELGEHTDAVLAGLGYSAPEIAHLREAGAL
jgi:crotonobetainyl-CoA:carnitine CoA-transferase CaiB-like acyl-CoA transferase